MSGHRIVGHRGRLRLMLFSLLPAIAMLSPGRAQPPPTPPAQVPAAPAPAAQAPLTTTTVTGVAAVTAIADATTGRRVYVLVLKGTNFAADKNVTDNVLISKKYPQIVPCQAPAANDPTQLPPGCVTVHVSADHRQITYTGVPGDHAGPDQITVTTDGSSSGDRPFVDVIYPDQPKNLAWLTVGGVAVALIIGMLGIAMALRCLYQFRQTMAHVPQEGGARRAVGMFETLLIDPKTNTYSLSSFQFAAWSFAFLLSYGWLFAGRVLVQDGTQFIDLQSDFATMLGATAGTSVISTGIDAAKGSKGAGEKSPSFGDLVSNGGVFAPERFQFLVWTIVGITAYLIVAFKQPLDLVSSLPQVGTGILGLSGISGLAYLGGKLVRTAGPVIDTAKTLLGTTGGTTGVARVVRLTGQQLPLDPTGAYVVTDHLGNRTTLLPGVGEAITALAPAGAKSGYATQVEVRLPRGFVFPGTIAAMTPDQQKAVVELLDLSPAVTAVAVQPAVAGAAVRRLTGQQLPLTPASYRLTPTGGGAAAAPTAVVAVQPAGATTGFATEVDLTLPANLVLPATLAVTNPDDQKTSAEIPA